MSSGLQRVTRFSYVNSFIFRPSHWRIAHFYLFLRDILSQFFVKQLKRRVL